MSATVPTRRLETGVELPALGLGVYQTPPGQTAEAVRYALEAGYRLVDTAAAYGNEREVGEGIARAEVDRPEVFVTTKLWNTDHGYDATLRAFEASLRRLGLEWLDLYLIHWPLPAEWDGTVAAYRAAERLLADGLVRAIGVSNHTPAHLDTLMERTGSVPAVNQIELHPFFSQPQAREHHRRHGIVTQSWSPLGGVYVYGADDPDRGASPLEHPAVLAIAQRYGRTPAQVVLRWHLQHGLTAIPKSVHPERIAQNLDVLGITLDADEMATIDALDTGVRGGPDPDQVDSATFG